MIDSWRYTHFKHYFRKFLRTSPKFTPRKIMLAYILSALAAYLNVAYFRGPQLEILNYVRGTREAPAKVVLIGADDQSYRELNLSPRHPFPREVFARAISEIATHGPKLLLLDFYIPNEPGNEQATKELADALSLVPSVISLVRDISNPNMKDSAEGYQAVAFDSDPLIRQSVSMEVPFRSISDKNVIMQIRSNAHATKDENELFSFLKPLRKFVDPTIKAPGKADLINFYGPAGTIRRFSLWELFSESSKIPPGFFKDKVVVIGFQSLLKERGHSDKELFRIPMFGEEMYGAEIHATVASNLINGEWIRRIHEVLEVLVFQLLYFVMLFGLFTFSFQRALTFTFSFFSIWVVSSYISFTWFYFFLPSPVALHVPNLAIIACYLLNEAILKHKELEELKTTMGLSVA